VNENVRPIALSFEAKNAIKHGAFEINEHRLQHEFLYIKMDQEPSSALARTMPSEVSHVTTQQFHSHRQDSTDASGL
jgi:hypothetical protein